LISAAVPKCDRIPPLLILDDMLFPPSRLIPTILEEDWTAQTWRLRQATSRLLETTPGINLLSSAHAYWRQP
jgi:hypothetical protein